MLNPRQLLGKKGESLAATHLQKNGYTILEQNYRSKHGEIDIIAQDKDSLVFIEVKARRSGQFGSPKMAITLKKQRKISMVALYYLKATKQNRAKARFDVVVIDPPGDHPSQVKTIKNAFDLAYT
ncbi:MAG: YraN family protein [Desulfobacterales bacterium]|nr:YraN family protein [Desulfobacterales bacterium]